MPKGWGWPAKHTKQRKWLDDLYWGNKARVVDEGWYLYPSVHSEVAISPLATLRDAHIDESDTDVARVYAFAAYWKRWIGHHQGRNLEQRRSYDSIRIDRRKFDWPPGCAMLLYGQPRLPR